MFYTNKNAKGKYDKFDGIPSKVQDRDEIRKALQTSTALLNYNYDVSTIIKSINGFSFLNNKVVFNDAQFNIFNYLCKQTFIGEYIIGFPIDNFESKINDPNIFEDKLNNFKRALRDFRKNMKFNPFDDKLIEKFSYFSSISSSKKFYTNLKVYYKLAEEFLEQEKQQKGKKKDKNKLDKKKFF